MGASSGEVSFSLIGVCVHPSIYYVSLNFLHEVSYYALDWLFFDVQFDRRMDFDGYYFEGGGLDGGDSFSGASSNDMCKTLS